MIDRADQLSITLQCDLLGINRSSFYYLPIPESEENLKIMQKLDEQYIKTPFFGTKKLLILLIALGYRINIKRLRRLKKLVNWNTIYPTRKTSISNPKEYKYPYLLNDLEINRVNQVWAIDITYLPMRRGFMYLFAIIDHYTRFVVGWSISNSMTTEWCTTCIKESIENYGTPDIMNSDQGSQFTSEEYVKLLKDNGIQISMDGKGRYKDNIFIERLWRSVKYENVYLYAYEEGLSLWKGLSEYFNFYNQERFHENLDYQTPQQVYFKSVA
jgi:putative transposase